MSQWMNGWTDMFSLIATPYSITSVFFPALKLKKQPNIPFTSVLYCAKLLIFMSKQETNTSNNDKLNTKISEKLSTNIWITFYLILNESHYIKNQIIRF